MRLLIRSTPCCGIACVADRTARSSPLWQGAVPFVASASLAAAVVSIASPAAAATNASGLAAEPVFVFGIPVDFILFALTLIGVAIFHHKTLQVALVGLATILVYKFAFNGFKFGPGLAGLGLHMQHEAVILANLFLLLMGFAILSRHFENSRIPDEMPAFLPDGWKGGLALLAIVFVLSSFLDNIAAALIGGTMARHVFRGKVHIGYLAGIVAASNAGGSGSVVGDTTTTMMWIDGVSPLSVLKAYVAAVAGFLIYGIPAAIQQHRYSPILKDAPRGLQIDWTSLVIVALILVIAIVANVTANLRYPALLDMVPVIGLAVWIVILATAALRRPDWEIMPESLGHDLPARAGHERVADAGGGASAGLVADRARPRLPVFRVRQHPAHRARA